MIDSRRRSTSLTSTAVPTARHACANRRRCALNTAKQRCNSMQSRAALRGVHVQPRNCVTTPVCDTVTLAEFQSGQSASKCSSKRSVAVLLFAILRAAAGASCLCDLRGSPAMARPEVSGDTSFAELIAEYQSPVRCAEPTDRNCPAPMFTRRPTTAASVPVSGAVAELLLMATHQGRWPLLLPFLSRRFAGPHHQEQGRGSGEPACGAVRATPCPPRCHPAASRAHFLHQD